SKGCPLDGKECPYFEQHKKDSKLADFVVSPGDECPLAKKCSFYKEVKEGHAPTEWKTSKCPLGDKCPYYGEIKSKGAAATAHDCPVLHNCPHFSKEAPGTPHPHPHSHKGEAAKCPHLKKETEEK
ncbi:hypothetical protein BDK51DRAFT_13710, partial [Blyttiomyces helicus]